ncbi:MAG: hypothetical protein ABIR37_00900 [Candidatus Saccharimonadales bacterium]
MTTLKKGPHEWLRLRVVWPSSDTDPADHAEAISSDVFDADFAWEEQNRVSIARVVGGVVLRDGHILEAHGNTKAHNGEELEKSLSDLALLEDGE